MTKPEGMEGVTELKKNILHRAKQLILSARKKHSPSWKITLAQTKDLPTTPLRLVIRQSLNLKLFSLLIHDTRLKRRPK